MSLSDPIIERPRNLEDLRRVLEPWLSEHLGGAPEVKVGDFHYPKGAGVSNETLMFSASWERDGTINSRALVLRVAPHAKTLFLEPVFREQFELLQILRDEDGILVPEPLWFESDPNVIGQAFFVMEKVVGKVPVSQPAFNSVGWLADAPVERRRRMWTDSMDQLCRIHQVDTAKLGFLDLPQWGDTPLAQQLALWERMLGWSTDDDPLPVLVEVLDWLKAEAPASPESGLSWGDARVGNILYDDELHVTAVLDWEQASLGGPMLDLGWWLFYDDYTSTCQGIPRLEGLGTRAETLEYWEAATGGRVESLHWYEVFAGYKLALLTCRLKTLSAGVKGRPLVEQNTALAHTLELLDGQHVPRSSTGPGTSWNGVASRAEDGQKQARELRRSDQV